MSEPTPHPLDEVPARRRINAAGVVIAVLGAPGSLSPFTVLAALPLAAATWRVRAVAAGLALAVVALTLWTRDLARLDARLTDQLGDSSADVA